jgi:hypothetical protein
MIERSPEAEAFFATITEARPEQISACDGWTTHEIAAHITGTALEIVRHLEPYPQGEVVPKTRSFEEREAPLQALSHADLLARLERDEQRMRTMVADVLAREPDAEIPWTGRQMAVAKFIPHMRNEHALHRWDVVGDDAVSPNLLSELSLVQHSVGVLGAILLVAGRQHDPDPDTGFRVRLRSAGQPDLLVIVEDGEATLAWAQDEREDPSVELDAAARQLFIWGRRPDDHSRLSSHLDQPDLVRLQALLSGY